MYNSFPSDYTTFERINAQLKSNTNEGNLTNDQSIVEQYIHVASDQIRNFCSRTFVPYIRDDADVLYSRMSRNYILPLPDGGLVVSQIKNGDGDIIPTADYQFRDIVNQRNGFPFAYVELGRDSNIYSYSDTTFVPAFTFNGIWGYSRRAYEQTWETLTTMAVNMNATVLTLIVDDSSNIEVFDYIRLDTEFLQVTANDIANKTLTLTRGVNGSTAASHDGSGTPIDVERWAIEDAVKDACTRLTAYLYSSRQGTGNTIVFQDGAVVSQYPALVWSSLLQYKRPIFESV